jgi:ribonuclease HI
MRTSGGKNLAHEKKMKEFFVSSASALPNPSLSAIAFRCTRPKRRGMVIAFDKMTSSDAALRALLEVLHAVGANSTVLICTDSRLVRNEFKEIYAASSHDLGDPHGRARKLLETNRLSVELRMVPRIQNPARTVLDEFKVALRQERRRMKP